MSLKLKENLVYFSSNLNYINSCILVALLSIAASNNSTNPKLPAIVLIEDMSA